MDARTRFESGRGSTQQDYLAFWTDGKQVQSASAHVVYPPHEAPRGSILDELLLAAVREKHPEATAIVGGVSMYGTDREICFGDGRIASAAFEQNGWRVYQ
jgi:hypothetical protein